MTTFTDNTLERLAHASNVQIERNIADAQMEIDSLENRINERRRFVEFLQTVLSERGKDQSTYAKPVEPQEVDPAFLAELSAKLKSARESGEFQAIPVLTEKGPGTLWIAADRGREES